MIAVAIYLYARAGELKALEWSDVDLKHGTVQVHSAMSEAGEIKVTKSGAARTSPIEPALIPLLKIMREESPAATHVFPWLHDENPRHLARTLRTALEKAELKRKALMTTDENRQRLRFHDLRASGITWAAVRGDDPLKIKQRAGHEDFDTTQRYLREAENLTASFGVPFPPLPDCLLGASPDGTSGPGGEEPSKASKTRESGSGEASATRASHPGGSLGSVWDGTSPKSAPQATKDQRHGAEDPMPLCLSHRDCVRERGLRPPPRARLFGRRARRWPRRNHPCRGVASRAPFLREGSAGLRRRLSPGALA